MPKHKSMGGNGQTVAETPFQLTMNMKQEKFNQRSPKCHSHINTPLMNINTNTNTDAKHINVCIQFIIHCWNNEYFSVDAASATPTAVNTVRINAWHFHSNQWQSPAGHSYKFKFILNEWVCNLEYFDVSSSCFFLNFNEIPFTDMQNTHT